MDKTIYNLAKVLISVTVLAILAANILFGPRPATAVACADCTPDLNWCVQGCPNQTQDPSGYSQCARQCVGTATQCQSITGNSLDCDAVYSTCSSGLQGSDVGTCFGNYATCSYTGFQRGYAMMQSPPPDDDPCFELANDDFFQCVDTENTESPCNQYTGTTRYQCCAASRDTAKTACLGL